MATPRDEKLARLDQTLSEALDELKQHFGERYSVIRRGSHSCEIHINFCAKRGINDARATLVVMFFLTNLKWSLSASIHPYKGIPRAEYKQRLMPLTSKLKTIEGLQETAIAVEAALLQTFREGNQVETKSEDENLDDSSEELRANKKDLLLVNLLSMVLGSNEANAAQIDPILNELNSLEVVSSWAVEKYHSPTFSSALQKAFRDDEKSAGLTKLLEFGASGVKYACEFDKGRVLGSGAFGKVQLCQHKLDKQFYAVKKIYMKTNSSMSQEKLLREVIALSRMHHKNIVRYHQAWLQPVMPGCKGSSLEGSLDSYGSDEASISYGSDEAPDCYLFIQMEFCPRSLQGGLEIEKKLFSIGEYAWDWFEQIVEGLQYMHENRVIHRDIKPNNILVDEWNVIKISDFGLAKLMGSAHSPSRNSNSDNCGVSVYKAPELRHDKPINEKVDIYSLGVVLFEMLHPFRSGHQRVEVLENLGKKQKFPEDWEVGNPGAACLIRWMVSSDPTQRPSAAILRTIFLPPEVDDLLKKGYVGVF